MKDDNNTTTTKAPDRIAELITERYELLKAGALTPEKDAAIRRAAIDEVSMKKFGFLEGNFLSLDMTTYVQRIKDLAPLRLTVHDAFREQTHDMLFSDCLWEFRQDIIMHVALKQCLRCFTNLEVELLELHRGADTLERYEGHHGAIPVLDPSRLKTVNEYIRDQILVYGALLDIEERLVKTFFKKYYAHRCGGRPVIRRAFDWTAFVKADGTVVHVLEKDAPFRVLGMNFLTTKSNPAPFNPNNPCGYYDTSDFATTIAPCDEEGRLITREDGSTLSWIIKESDFQHLDHECVESNLAELRRKMAGK